MKHSFISMVRWFVNIFFIGYLIVVPLVWTMMIAEYFDGNRIMLTQIRHGAPLGSTQDASAEVKAGKPFALEETSSALWVKTDSLLHHLFFTRMGDRDGFGMNGITMFFGLAITYLLKRILDSIKKEGVFTIGNARRIMLMGWILIGKFFYLALLSFWMSNFLKELDLPYKSAIGYGPDGSDFHIGILLFCIGLVYREGVKLKTEAELVI